MLFIFVSILALAIVTILTRLLLLVHYCYDYCSYKASHDCETHRLRVFLRHRQAQSRQGLGCFQKPGVVRVHGIRTITLWDLHVFSLFMETATWGVYHLKH